MTGFVTKCLLYIPIQNTMSTFCIEKRKEKNNTLPAQKKNKIILKKENFFEENLVQKFFMCFIVSVRVVVVAFVTEFCFSLFWSLKL